MNKKILQNEDVAAAASSLADALAGSSLSYCVRAYCVPRGGVPAGYALKAAVREKVQYGIEFVDSPKAADLIIDDLVDSGSTMAKMKELNPNAVTAALYTSDTSLVDFYGEIKGDDWLVFPWEVTETHDTSAEDVVLRMLQRIGEDPTREGLLETPRRVVKAWDTWFSGYGQDPAAVLKVFEDGAEGVDTMVLETDIPVYSFCEHHMAPIFGVAHVTYIPTGKVVGLSKLVRLVDIFARRLQVQERLTKDIADAIETHLKPLGVGVVLQCRHMCMESRGVCSHGVVTTTSALRGALRDEPEARAEFMTLINMSKAQRSQIL